MANTKEVDVEGVLPYNYNGNSRMAEKIGWLSQPALNIKLEWNRRGEYYVPNEHGGRTAMYPFRLHGAEALSYQSLRDFVRLVQESGGKITKARTRDVEDGGQWQDSTVFVAG